MEQENKENRGRPSSPEYYTNNPRSREQSPEGSFYHDELPEPTWIPDAWIPDDYETYYSGPDREWPSTLDAGPADSDSPDQWDSDSNDSLGSIRKLSSDVYQHIAIAATELRLLRIEPGPSESDLSCSLKIVTLEKLVTKTHEFQALSYAWGDDHTRNLVLLNDLPRSGHGLETVDSTKREYFVRSNLHHALKHVRDTDHVTWLWCDAICIDQTNESEKSQQIPMMPRIYSSAWNVIAWLGIEESETDDVEKATDLIPVLLNLKMVDAIVRGRTTDGRKDVLLSWAAFGRLIMRPWFKRRWVIQEVACARRLSVRVANKVMSWLDFADAVDIFTDNYDRIREYYARSRRITTGRYHFNLVDSSEAVALMRFSRSVFQRSANSSIASRLMSLESLVLTASPFVVSDVRDTIYALLYLANDMHNVIDTSPASQVQYLHTSDYSRDPVEIYKDFVRYSIAKSSSLDVIYRQWATCPRSDNRHELDERSLPSWIGEVKFAKISRYHQRHIPSKSFLGPVGSPVYQASHGVTFHAQATSSTIDDVLQAHGILLGTVEIASVLAVNRGMLKSDLLGILGWSGSLEEGIDDQLWKTLVANRTADSKPAPTWYRRACALALTQLDDSGDLDSAALIRDTSQPSTLVDYLQRIREATAHRKIFRCRNPRLDDGRMPTSDKAPKAIVGLGPEHMESHDQNLVCILYGSSVPAILRVIDKHMTEGDKTLHVKLVGPCYAHGHMEGEIFAGMSETEIKSRTMKFSIH